MKNDAYLAKYLADYLIEEWVREYARTDEFAHTVDNFLDNIPETVQNGIAAFRGGAAEGFAKYGNVQREA